MKIRMSLFIKTFSVSLILLIVLFFGMGFYYLITCKSNLNNLLVDKGRLVIKMYQPILVQDIINYNDIALLSYIDRIESVEDISYAMIVNKDGKVLAHSNVYEIGKVYRDEFTTWAVGVQEFSHRLYKRDNKDLFLCSYPLDDPELGIVAFMMLGLSTESVKDRLISEQKKFFIFSSLFVTIFLIFILTYFYWSMFRPIRLIRDGVKLMNTNLEHFKFNIKTNDEIRDVYNNINELVSNVRNNLISLEKIRDEVLVEEEKRLEDILSLLCKDNFFIIADEDNKVIFSNTPYQILGKDIVVGAHIIDVLKDTEIVNLITSAYSNKGTLVKDVIYLGEKKYLTQVFVIIGRDPFKDKTVIIFSEEKL